MSNLADALDAKFAPAWRPKPGDKLVGTVTELGERDGAYGMYPIVTVRKEDGEELAFHAFHDVAQSELARIAPKHGDEIGIKYEGKDPEKGYHRYRVVRGGENASVSWSKYGAPADEPESDVPVPNESERAAEPTGADDDIPF